MSGSRERIYERRPRPLCPPHVITKQYYSLLRFFIQKPATMSCRRRRATSWRWRSTTSDNCCSGRTTRVSGEHSTELRRAAAQSPPSSLNVSLALDSIHSFILNEPTDIQRALNYRPIYTPCPGKRCHYILVSFVKFNLFSKSFHRQTQL